MKIPLDIPQPDLEKLIAPSIAEPRIPLYGITWQQYENFIEMFSGHQNLHLTYLQGVLEIVTLSPEHEMLKTLIARLLYIYADALDIDLFSCGSATCKSQSTNRGLEPDESFCIGDRKSFPDLAIEVTVTSGGINKLEIYQGLQIPEVWFYQRDRFSLYRIKQDGSGYQEINQSQIFPNLDLNLMAQYIRPDREPEMVRTWRKFINTPFPPKN
ncbi:Uma2 family endonuclease [Pseudanabaena sp. FACHB-1277]|uniref:Uma2 family endonuclease n=1 Tax=Pseudanabaena cinerea FACHB-1277 TaxID=2949581 RepID=A0A926UV67_9CYAN|nr:Uma2 family endonuclease [Pseudanabaena cinerea]MBD2151441.1 Uma2 family endonuclease [Pseudanabaena cinerea FACHB-1277]